MNLLIFSDSHGNLRAMEKAVALQAALPLAQRPDFILFLGDGLADFNRLDIPAGVSSLAVSGNCDGFSIYSEPELRVPVLADKRTVMTHGHRFSVKGGLERAVAFAVAEKADILLFGHTHVPFAEQYEAGSVVCGVCLPKPLLLFNPGSIREGSFGSVSITEKGILASCGRI